MTIDKGSIRGDTERRLGASVALRRCGGDQRHTDLACRFVTPAPDHGLVVAEIRSKIFDDEPASAPSAG